MSNSTSQTSENAREFVEIYSENMQSVRGYILTLVPNFADAEDVLQDVSRVLWRKYSEYERGTNFLAWACRIAEFEAKRYWREQKQKKANILFSDNVLCSLNDELKSQANELDDRLDLVGKCMQELSPTARDALSMRYQDSATAEVVAEKIHKSLEATYKILSRSLRAIVDCVQRRRSMEVPDR